MPKQATEKSFSTEVICTPVTHTTKTKQRLLLHVKVRNGEDVNVRFTNDETENKKKQADEKSDDHIEALEALKNAEARNDALAKENLRLAEELAQAGKAKAGDAQLELAQNRLESTRSEFKNFKNQSADTIAALEQDLVAAQVELGELKGEGAARQAMLENASKHLEQLRPWVGIEIAAGPPNGVKVMGVKPGGPTELAGFQIDDVIEQANGEYTKVNNDFRTMIRKVVAGDVISFQVQRGTQIKNFMVEIASRDMNFLDITRLRRIAQGMTKPGDDKFMERIDKEHLLESSEEDDEE